MIDDDQLRMLVYSHAVALTQIDHPVEEALAIARHLAASAFDDRTHQVGMMVARDASAAAAEPREPALPNAAGGHVNAHPTDVNQEQTAPAAPQRGKTP